MMFLVFDLFKLGCCCGFTLCFFILSVLAIFSMGCCVLLNGPV